MKPSVRVQTAVGAILGAWAVGLVVASARLQAWQQEMAQVLAEVQADALVRASPGGAAGAAQPQWQRQRAIALMTAVERLQDGAAWTWVMPGSWSVFDDLEERALARIGRTFGQGVVQALGREVERRAAAASGASLHPGTGYLEEGGGCGLPPVAAGGLELPVEATPEFIAVLRLVEEAERLDQATAALRRLRHPHAHADDLRLLADSILGTALRGSTPRSLAWFAAHGDPQDPGFDAMTLRLQGAMRCGVRAAMDRLHRRLVEDNPLLALEQAAWLSARADLFNREEGTALARLHRASGQLEALDALLATQPHGWMGDEAAPFGRAHQALVDRMRTMTSLGPEFAQALEHSAQDWRERLQARLAERLARSADRLAWDRDHHRLTLPPGRAALREGLRALLREPFMAPRDDGKTPEAASAQTATPVALVPPEALADLVEQRLRVEREVLPRLPQALQVPARAFVDQRVAGLALTQARSWLLEAPPQVREDRLRQLQADLEAAGAPSLSAWIGLRLAEEALGSPLESPLSTPGAPAGRPPPADSAGEAEAPASSAD
ncbi:hypothetical protein ACT80S_14830 [Ramlibacter sp. MAHUQ-53]|uniref:hypothetical protein n=1 Tax=unclassified Ramlibacter TaxID=2617605 RepID=UPI003631AF57